MAHSLFMSIRRFSDTGKTGASDPLCVMYLDGMSHDPLQGFSVNIMGLIADNI